MKRNRHAKFAAAQDHRDRQIADLKAQLGGGPSFIPNIGTSVGKLLGSSGAAAAHRPNIRTKRLGISGAIVPNHHFAPMTVHVPSQAQPAPTPSLPSHQPFAPKQNLGGRSFK